MKKVKKGQWYTYCCEDDLVQAKEDFVDDEAIGIEVWDIKEEALTELRKRGIIKT